MRGVAPAGSASRPATGAEPGAGIAGGYYTTVATAQAAADLLFGTAYATFMAASSAVGSRLCGELAVDDAGARPSRSLQLLGYRPRTPSHWRNTHEL